MLVEIIFDRFSKFIKLLKNFGNIVPFIEILF
jgi:hypothetical protein